MSNLNENQRTKEANKITILGLIVNILLTIFKFIAGFLGKSSAMLADAVHSVSDFATDIIVIISFRFSKLPADKTHNYGHGKFETLATAIIGIALAFVGFGIFYSGSKKIWDYIIYDKIIKEPHYIALFAAVLSIATKELLYQYTIKISKKINSNALKANAWHHRSDALSSIGTTIGIGGAILLGSQWTILDPIAAVIVSIFIIIAAYKISTESINELLEKSLDEKTENQIIEIIKSTAQTSDPHDLRTRRIGNKIAIDVHIRFENKMSIFEVHKINDIIEQKLRQEFGDNTIINIHSEPQEE